MEGNEQILLVMIMKIKIAILDKEQTYLSRVMNSLEGKFSDKLEIYCFTDAEKALNTVVQSNIDVFFASYVYEIETHRIPERCGFAYLVDTKDVDKYNGERAVCKFQKLESFYGDIVDIFTDKNDVMLSGSSINADVPLFLFTSASGGAGASVVAAAFAISMAREGKKTIYLNLENFGDSGFYFHGDGQYDLRDMMIALKSGKSNIAMKMETIAKKDKSGVYFIETPQNALDVGMLTTDDVNELVELFRKSGVFDCVVIDMNFAIGEKEISLFKQAYSIVFVSDASETSNGKLYRAYETLVVAEQKANASFLGRLTVFYNKVNGKSASGIDIPGISIIGAAPKFEKISAENIARRIAELGVFQELIK